MALSTLIVNHHGVFPSMETSTKEAPRLVELQQTLERRRDSLRRTLEIVEEQLKAVTTTLELLNNVGAGQLTVPTETIVPPPNLHGMTQVEALSAIARQNGGRVRIKDAHGVLLKAGLMKQTKNWYNILYNAINRSEKFERSSPGEYKLLE